MLKTSKILHLIYCIGEVMAWIQMLKKTQISLYTLYLSTSTFDLAWFHLLICPAIHGVVLIQGCFPWLEKQSTNQRQD